MEREQVVTFLLSLWQRWADYVQTNFDNPYVPYVPACKYISRQPDEASPTNLRASV